MTSLKPLLERTPDGRHLIRLNNSHYKEPYSACSRANYYALIAGLKEPDLGHISAYGTSCHKAWQAWALGKPVAECIQIAVDHLLKYDCNTDFRNPTHLEKTLIAWFAEYGSDRPEVYYGKLSAENFGENAKPAVTPFDGVVEYQWQFPIYSDSFAVVVLQGTIDLVHLVGGKPRVRDYKTTADKDPEKKLEQLLTSTQFLTYELGVRECLGITDATYEICGVFLRQDKNGKSASEFKSSRVMSFESEWGRARVARHKGNLQAFAKDLVTKLELGNFGGQLVTEQLLELFNEDYRPCNQGWGCPYRGITNATSVSDKEFIAANSFDKRIFDAHRHNEH